MTARSKACYHESGHAVAAVLVGVQVIEAMVNAVGGGFCYPVGPLLFDQAAVLYVSGMVADEIHAGREPHYLTLYRDRKYTTDTRLYREARERAGLEVPRLADSVAKATTLLTTNWNAVTMAANTLIVHGSITGSYVQQIVQALDPSRRRRPAVGVNRTTTIQSRLLAFCAVAA